jgi:glutathione S-transferase
MKLDIGNKNYSSWSMRPWVLMRQAGIPFEEVMVRFDSFEASSHFKQTLATLSPTGQVPALQDGDLTLWDSLAIAEYLAERFPRHQLWPSAPGQRALARSVCATMHSGFTQLRQHCPMNIEADLQAVGAQIWDEQAGVRRDLQLMQSLWEGLLEQHGGPLLFGRFSIADAFFAPVLCRIQTYGLPLSGCSQQYASEALALPGVQAWIQAARTEHDFLAFEEPYRTAP